jgi:hypothetical protein
MVYSSGQMNDFSKVSRGVPLYVGGLREAYVCDALSSGFGASVLAFFGERGPVAVGYGGGPEWSGTGRLGDV